MSGRVVIVSVAGEEFEHVPQFWGAPPVVDSVQHALHDAGIACSAITVETASELLFWLDPECLMFPNARFFRNDRTYLSKIFDNRLQPYIGSSRIGHENESKSLMKNRLRAGGVPTPDFQVVRSTMELTNLLGLQVPYMLKPDCGTESYGVVRIDDPNTAIGAGKRLAARFGWPLVAEAWSRFREFTVGVLGYGPHRFAFPIEIVVPDDVGYLNEELKLAGAATTTQPVTDTALNARLSELAVAAARCLHVRDCVRMEILQDQAGAIHVIDVNTLPGLRPGPHHQSYLLSCLSANLGFGQTETVLAIIAAAADRLGMRQHSSAVEVWKELKKWGQHARS